MSIRSTFQTPALVALGGIVRWALPVSLIGVAVGWRVRTRTRHDLALLDARLLRDIGLTTRDASHEVQKPFWRP